MPALVWRVCVLAALAAITSAEEVDCSGAGLDGDCGEAGRQPCGTVENTCGPCLEGYENSAEPGFGNSVCSRVQCSIPAVANASPAAPGPVDWGSSVRINCFPGFVTATNAGNFQLTCKADGSFSGMQACVDFDACDRETNPCGNHKCIDVPAPSLKHRCECSDGFAGLPELDGSGCFETRLDVKEGQLVATAADLALDVGGSGTILSLSAMADAMDEGTLSTDQRISAVEDAIDAIGADTLDRVADDIASLSTTLQTELEDLTASVAAAPDADDLIRLNDVIDQAARVSTMALTAKNDLASEITRATGAEAELSTTVSELSQIASLNEDDIATLRNDLVTLTTSHLEQAGDNDITKALAATLDEALSSEVERAKAAEGALAARATALEASMGAVSLAVNGNTAAINNEATRARGEETKLSNALKAAVDTVDEHDTKLEAVNEDVAGLVARVKTLEGLVTLRSSCKEILDAGLSTGSKVYRIKPVGYSNAAGISVYCDMDTDGGGWTRVGNINEAQFGRGSSAREVDHNNVNLMIDHADLNHKSFAALWYNTQPTSAMIIHYTGPGGSGAGTNHRLRMTWNNNKFQLYNFNNHVLDDCRNLDTGTVWSGCRYASHDGSPWQLCTFAFTVGNLVNGYSGNSDRRLILGPTGRPTGAGCYWYNFGADSNSANRASSWVNIEGKTGYLYMR